MGQIFGFCLLLIGISVGLMAIAFTIQSNINSTVLVVLLISSFVCVILGIIILVKSS